MQIDTHSPFEDAFTPGTRFVGDQGDIIEMSVCSIGDLKLPTGRIVVCDPFATPLDTPGAGLTRVAPRGVFPVDVAIARFEENDDRRVACARIRFTEHPNPTRWEAALFQGQGPLTGGALPGYGVDSGFGCFCDEAVLTEVTESHLGAWLAAARENEVSTWTWHVGDAGKANVALVSSGWGDGFYGSFWGIDVNNEAVELVTDFRVLLGVASATFETSLPLSAFPVSHPLLREHDITLRGAIFSRTTAIMSGKGSGRVELPSGAPVTMRRRAGQRLYTWQSSVSDKHLVVRVMTGIKQLSKL